MIRTSFFNLKIRLAVLAFGIVFITSCDKEKIAECENHQENSNSTNIQETTTSPSNLLKVMSVAHIRTLDDGTTQVMFNENAQVFTLKNESDLATLRTSLENKTMKKVEFNPWTGEVVKISEPSVSEIKIAEKKIVKGLDNAIKLDGRSMDYTQYDVPERIGSLNTTGPGLTNVIPDMATALSMFNYIAQQCCAIGAPYEIDQCISFQYAQDGCYARAHKMCYILNNTYHYATNKIFSFANAGGDVLSVQAQKWGGCCVNWWYHVAPLVNIKTPTGVKAYVFDPAMFNQPVLLSEWLRAQENPACVSWGVPNVSMINLQPTEMYAPSDWSGYMFMTDPAYFDTNSTMVAYSGYITCP